MKIDQVKSAQDAKTLHNNTKTNESNRVEERSARIECKTQRQRDSVRARERERDSFKENSLEQEQTEAYS